MSARIGEHVRHNVVGYIAIFLFAIGGTAYAVDGPLPGQNQVGSEDIITGEVKSTDIADGRVFNVDLADNLITGEKMKDGTLTGLDIGNGTLVGGHIANDALTGHDVAEFTLSKVPDADTLDGKNSNEFTQGSGRVIANRVVTETQGTQIIAIPFMGVLAVDGCDHTNGRITFSTAGNATVYVTAHAGGSITYQQPTNLWISATVPSAFYELQVARNVGGDTQIATITVTWKAADCVFAAQALQTPAL